MENESSTANKVDRGSQAVNKSVPFSLVPFSSFWAGYWAIELLLNKASRPPQGVPTTDEAATQEPQYRSYIASHYHSILGLTAEASREQIETAYRQLCEQSHPDTVAHKGAEFRELAEFKMRQLKDAYELALAECAARGER